MSGTPWANYAAPTIPPPPPSPVVRCYTCDARETMRAPGGAPSVCTHCAALIREARERDAQR